MPIATPAQMRDLKTAMEAAAHGSEPALAPNVATSLVVRGLLTPAPQYRLTARGETAYNTGIIPATKKSHGITWADTGPDRWTAFLRHGPFQLTRATDKSHWLLTDAEASRTHPIHLHRTDDAIDLASLHVRAWIEAAMSS